MSLTVEFPSFEKWEKKNENYRHRFTEVAVFQVVSLHHSDEVKQLLTNLSLPDVASSPLSPLSATYGMANHCCFSRFSDLVDCRYRSTPNGWHRLSGSSKWETENHLETQTKTKRNHGVIVIAIVIIAIVKEYILRGERTVGSLSSALTFVFHQFNLMSVVLFNSRLIEFDYAYSFLNSFDCLSSHLCVCQSAGRSIRLRRSYRYAYTGNKWTSQCRSRNFVNDKVQKEPQILNIVRSERKMN